MIGWKAPESGRYILDLTYNVIGFNDWWITKAHIVEPQMVDGVTVSVNSNGKTLYAMKTADSNRYVGANSRWVFNNRIVTVEVELDAEEMVYVIIDPNENAAFDASRVSIEITQLE